MLYQTQIYPSFLVIQPLNYVLWTKGSPTITFSLHSYSYKNSWQQYSCSFPCWAFLANELHSKHWQKGNRNGLRGAWLFRWYYHMGIINMVSIVPFLNIKVIVNIAKYLIKSPSGRNFGIQAFADHCTKTYITNYRKRNGQNASQGLLEQTQNWLRTDLELTQNWLRTDLELTQNWLRTDSEQT